MQEIEYDAAGGEADGMGLRYYRAARRRPLPSFSYVCSLSLCVLSLVVCVAQDGLAAGSPMVPFSSCLRLRG